MEGIINILKPPGMTSHDVVNFVRRTFGIKRVGHGGTLDPAAAGVLPVFVGRATKSIQFFDDDDKEYIAEIIFGVTTDTADSQGNILQFVDKVQVDISQLEEVLESLTGSIEQVPPMFSAVRHKGKRLYELARQGITVERKPRKVYVSRIELLDLKANAARLRVTCSRGTYIRTLSEDIGEMMGFGACLGTLIRTRSGKFSISSSKTLEEISQHSGDYQDLLTPIDIGLNHLPAATIDIHLGSPFGRGINFSYICDTSLNPGELVRVYNRDKFLGVAKVNPGKSKLTVIKSFNRVDGP